MRCSSRLRRLTATLTAIWPVVLAAQDPPPVAATGTTLNATASFPTDRFIASDSPVGFTLTRPLGPSDGRLALVVGSMDVSALAEQSATSIAYRPRSVRLPRGESEAVLYLVNAGAWTELARVPLKVLATGGFTSATTKASAALTMKGQLAEGHSADAPEPERATYQDFSASGGLQSAHMRNGWTLRTQSNYLGVSRREEALRWGLRQNEAPRFDLSDYVVQIERGRTTFGLGHVSTGSNRHLMNEFASRGASVSVRGGAASLAVAALNGSSVVGWDNFAGLDHGDHRIYSATLGVELRPRRPGALHVNATVLDGSLLPQTSFSQGAVVDAERSTGTGVQLSASTPSQRLRAAVGYTRSRFDNPIERDTELDSGIAVVPVRREVSGAGYVELNAVLLQNATLAKLFASTLNAGYRHERVDPLYRSVAASVQGDRLQHTGDLGGNIGALSFQLSHGRGSDNLDRLASVLTTRTRTSAATATLPTAGLFRVRRHVARWPQLGYALMRTHQFGVGVPVDADFSPTHVPDQMSVVHDATAAWQGEKWRLQYRFNRSDQDNRQVGRERADLAGTSNTVSAGVSIRTYLDLSVDASDERQSNRELVQRNTVRRLAGTVNWRATALTTLTAFASTSVSSDVPSTSDADDSEVRFELARGFDLWRNAGGGGTRGQLFLRYANQSSSLHQRSLEAPDVPTVRAMRAAWTLSSGATLRVF